MLRNRNSTISGFRRQGLCCGLVICGLVALCSQAMAQNPPAQAKTSLALGQSLKREIKAGETHLYSVQVEKDLFVQVTVAPQGVDVTLTATTPDGHQLDRSQDSSNDAGVERISLISAERQTILFEVRAPKKGGKGSYTVTLTTLRPSQNNDRDLIRAESLWREGREIGVATAESRREAIARLKPAAETFQRIGELGRAAQAFSSLARNYHGDHDKALSYYEQALSIFHELGSRRQEALTLAHIGIIHGQSGDFDKALDYHTRSLMIRRELGLRVGEAGSSNQIGLVYFRLGDPKRALTYHLQSLPVFRTEARKFDLVALLGFIGGDYYAMGQYGQALDYFNQALQLAETYWVPRIRPIILLRYVGLCNLKLGQIEIARDAFNEALTREQKFIVPYERGNSLGGLGETFYKLKDLDQARAYLIEAIPLLHNAGDRAGEANAHYWLARVELESDKLPNALSEIEKSVRIVERVRSGLTSPELRTLYFASAETYYNSYLEILWRLHREQPAGGFDQKALQVSEQSRARSLVELLNEARLDIRQGVSPELLARERELQKQINSKAQVQDNLLITEQESPGEGNGSAENINAGEIERLTDQLLDVRAEIRRQNPRYASLTQPQSLTLKEIQETLDRDTIVLEYKLGEPRSFLWAIGQSEFHSFELPAREQIESLARQFYDSIAGRNRAPQNSSALVPQLPEAGDRLSRLLLGPVADYLATKRLIIVTEGALQYIPFAALSEPTSKDAPGRTGAQPLLLKHEIVNLPSATVIMVLREQMAARKPAPRTLALFADPVFAKDDSRVTEKRGRTAARKSFRATTFAKWSSGTAEDPSIPGPSITRLPFSRREANAILTSAPASETYVALDFNANRTNAISPSLIQYRMIHFATHGWLNSTRPELSGVILSLVDDQGRPQNGVVRLHEIYNLQLNADLVVLSACQTALGKEVRGEGLIGLTRGFMYAGATRVAASLWKVDDAATAELMNHFYHFMLKEKLSPAASLRAAQLEVARQRRWSAPYYWAGFVLQGEWR